VGFKLILLRSNAVRVDEHKSRHVYS